MRKISFAILSTTSRRDEGQKYSGKWGMLLGREVGEVKYEERHWLTIS